MLVALALTVATFWFLPQLARYQFTKYLREQAAHALALDAAGRSPYQWQFRDADDIVAGRVFGAREFSFDDGLRVRSEGTSFEVGLPLTRPVDLMRFPILHIVASAEVPATLRVVLRKTLDAPEAVGSSMPMRGAEMLLDLRAAASPDRAAMLRLRFDLPAAQTLHLHAVSLDRAPNAPPAPIVELPTGSVERQLLEQRRIHEVSPAAVIIPAGSGTTFALTPARSADAPAAWEPNWIVTSAFVMILLFARLRPPHHARWRALVEIVLVLAVPLWLIDGGHFTGRVNPVQMCLIAATTIYAISLAWPRTWRWNGGARAWLLSAAVAASALCIGLMFFRTEIGLRPVGTGHFARYFIWALMQQYLVCALCLERWRTVTGSVTIAVYASALCFALLHMPNSSLMLATFAGGLCWCALYVRERALLPLAFSHAASALLLIALLPPDILLSAEVSARFFQ